MPIYKMQGKKNGLQKYRVRINYKNLQGEDKQMERVAYGAAEAKELEAKLLKEVKETPPEKRMTVQALYDEYITVKKYEIRESSLEKSKQNLTHHVLPILKNMKLTQLDPPILTKWKFYVEEKGLAFETKKKIYSSLRALLNYGIKMGYISSNPLTRIGGFKDAYQEETEIRYYTSEEFLKYISVAKSQAEEKGFYEWNYYVFFNIAFYTGMRKGEIFALKWSSIKNDTIFVRSSVGQKLKGEDRRTPPKNKTSNRRLMIPLPLKKILRDHYNRYKKVDNFTDDWSICGGEKCIRDSTVDSRNRLYSTLANLRRITIHEFRHTHATLLINHGVNIQEIARRLGHSDIRETWNTYAHLYPQEESKALEVLNNVL